MNKSDVFIIDQICTDHMQSQERPNILLLVLDTARFDFSVGEKGVMSTVKEISEVGTNYRSAISTSPWSLPSHASLFSAQYPSKHGTTADSNKFDISSPTLAECFFSAGYETVAVSNNTWISPEFGFSDGFETFRKNWQYQQTNTDFGSVARRENGLSRIVESAKLLLDGNPVNNALNAAYGLFQHHRAEDDGARRTNKWVDKWTSSRDPSQPFFLFVNYFEPHLPYKPPSEYVRQYLPEGTTLQEARSVSQDAIGYILNDIEMSDHDFEVLKSLYQAELAYLDDEINNLKTTLQNVGEWENTVVIITGDHGENIGEHGLMDHQYCLYNTLLHIPLTISGGSFQDGGTRNEIIQTVDLPLTLLDEANINASQFREASQGRTFHPRKNSDPRSYAYAEYLSPQPSMAALSKKTKNIPQNVRKYDRKLRSVQTDKYKLIVGSDGTVRLYNIKRSNKEDVDLSSELKEERNHLSDVLDSWVDNVEQQSIKSNADMDEDTKKRLEDLGYLQ